VKKTGLFVLGFLVLSIVGCSDDVTAPIESEFPEKLAPYETFYDAATFKKRRDDLISNIPNDAIAVVTTNDTYLRNGDVGYEFRPASNFFYLTGFDEPNAVAVIRRKSPSADTAELIMFVENREGIFIQWLGPVYGPEGAMKYFGADTAYEYESFGFYMRSYLDIGSYQSVYANLGTNQAVADSFYGAVTDTPAVYDIDEIVDNMRIIKYPIEVNSIQNYIDVSVQAFTEELKTIEPEMY